MKVAALAAVIAMTASLAGCNILAPTRNADGTIVSATQMPSTDAWVGDCFTFVEGSNLGYATVVPCAEPHTHAVIGKGTLSQKRIDFFGDLQVTVISACRDRFDLYQSTQEVELVPEYIVSTKAERDGTEIMHYSCLVRNA